MPNCIDGDQLNIHFAEIFIKTNSYLLPYFIGENKVEPICLIYFYKYK